MELIPTDEQRAIVDFVRRGKGSLVLDALAGSGKSWTLLEALKGIPQTSILMVAFNKPIAEHLKTKLPKLPKTHGVHVRTFHAQGLSIIKKHFPKIEVSKDANEQLINHVAGSVISFKMRRAALKLIRIVKETIATDTPPSAETVLALGYEYDIFTSKMNEREIGLTSEAVRDAYIVSLNLANRECIDFSDMVWAPVALNLAPPSRYQAVIVDELQDISEPQLLMLKRLMAPGGRFIASGDQKQQVYGWRGSLGSQAWSMVKEDLKAEFLPLTMTFRCSKAVVKAANRIVPELRAAPDAIEGSESECTLGDLPFKLANSSSDEIHTFVLSRTNADLVDAALYLWQQRVAFRLNTGQELLDPIFDLLKQKLDTRDEPAFLKTLGEWFTAESQRAEKANATAYAEKIEEQRKMLLAALKYSKPNGIAKLLNEILLPNQSGILCSTVHKVKGLEAERVFLLKQTFASFQERLWKFGDEWISVVGTSIPEELNLEYVGITRSKEHLIWVDITGPDARESPVNTFVLTDSLDDMTREELFERFTRVESMATRTQDPKLADTLMLHARAIENELAQIGDDDVCDR